MLDAADALLFFGRYVYAGFLPSANTINDFEIRSGAGFHDIRADAMPSVALAIIFHRYGHLTLCVLADRYAADLEIFEVCGHARRSFDCLECCLDRAVAPLRPH